MTESRIPRQSAGEPQDDLGNGRPPVEPAFSEAGRFLCAGTYIDAGYRDRVIEELYVHEERIVAPSYGFDASRVLAHALRARRAELGWALGVLGAWFVGSVLTGGALAVLLFPFLLLSLAGWLGARSGLLARLLSIVVRIYAWWNLLVIVVLVIGIWLVLLGAFDDTDGSIGLGALLFSQGIGGVATGFAIGWVPAVFAAVVTVVGLQRGYVARTIANDLSRDRYANRPADPAEADPGVRFARVRRRILDEQHSPLIMYDINDPFAGAGQAYRPWQDSFELRPREDLPEGTTPEPLTNARILDGVVPLVERLRAPSPHGSPQAQAAVLDRMRELVVDQCVFLPGGGLGHRDEGPHVRADFETHRAEAIEEGGERRRHFLRIRVGGWDENMVVTVFVRVHTQGGMMMVEVAPHVLLPVHAAFHNADADAHRYLNNNRFGKVIWALRHIPGSFPASLVTLGRGVASWVRIAAGGHGGARPEGPRASVRVLASQDNGSLFHLMDLDRYLKTIQDRVIAGITLVLHEGGWHTEAFARRASIHIENYVGAAYDSSISVGGSGNHNSTHRGSHGDR
ncbi:hypothetical protein [Streptomyces sp. DSM 41634]|uniref:hypothetical protein n=1 Tax=Streptomyces sp. DSM 41634 TaxID=3448656 RepID=UPI002886EEA5|nr:hypothetical protein [Streptomyces sp. DSM 41633]